MMSKASKQADLGAFSITSDEIDVTRTIRCKLETSQTKNNTVRNGISAYQKVAAHMADVLPSYEPHEWNLRNTQMYHQAKRALPEDDIQYKTTLAQMAMNDVVESYLSWRERGQHDDSPNGDFGEADYLALRHDDCELYENNRGWGVKTSFISWNPVWFHVRTGDYQRRFLKRVTNDNDPASAGSCELHLEDDGSLYLHQTITWPVEVYNSEDINTTVGVDLGDDPLAVAAVVSNGSVEDVLFNSGSEFRHHRERVKRRKQKAQEADNLKAIKESRLMYQRYTDHVTDKVSREVVDLAVTHRPAMISVEDLTDYRVTADDAIHDWPYAEMQTKIASKALEEGIPVTDVDPKNTSITCRNCGETNPQMREGADFECWDCGYQVHADLNAAINIAERATI